MASAELIVAFGAKLDGLEASLKRVNTKFGELERSAKATNDAIVRNTEKTASAFATLTANMGRAGGALLAIYAAIKSLEGVARVTLVIDDLNASINRLKVITSGTDLSARGVFGGLQQSAAQTGQSVASLTDQFQRFFVATRTIGASQAQVQALVQTLAQFSQLSGQKPQEAAAAITQLAQGLASGRLQGDELKSIMENMPNLAQALARELGVTVGQLRQMGEEGRLTADNVFPALLRAGNNLQQALAGLPLTLRQSWQVALDAMSTTLAELDRKIGATQFLSRLIQNFAEITRAAGQAVAGNNEGTPVETRLQILQREGAAAAASIQAAEEALRRLAGEEARSTRTGQPFNRDSNQEAVNAANRRRERAFQELERVNNQIRDLQERQDNANRVDAQRQEAEGRQARIAADARRARDILEGANPILKAQREREERINALNRTLMDRRVEASRQGAAERAEVERFGVEQLAAINKQYEEEVERAGAGAREEARRRAAEQRREEQQRLQQRRAEQRAVDDIARSGDSGLVGFLERMREWETENESVGSSFELFIQRVAGGTERVEVLFRGVAYEAERAAKSMVDAGEDPAPAIEALNQQLELLAIRLRLAGVNPEEIATQLTAAMNRANNAVQQMQDKVGMTFNDIKVTAVKNFASDAAGAIVDFATTAENKFGEVAASFAKNIAKMILNLLIFRAIVTGLRAYGVDIPGLTGTGRSIEGRMTGGPVDAGTPYVVGEKRPELFVPGSSGYIFPDTGSQEGLTVNVYNSAGANVRTQESTDSMGNRTLEIFVEEIVRKGMASGRFDGSMRQNFNLTRPGRV